MAIYDSIDLDWTWDGDYIVGDNGDLKDTSDDLLKSLLNEIHMVLRSEFNDWELNPTLGANASDFRGEPNTREVGHAIEQRYTSRIVAAGIVQPGDIRVKVIPVGVHQVMATLVINTAATPSNNLNSGEPLVVSLLYDSLEDSVFFLEDSKYEQDYRGA